MALPTMAWLSQTLASKLGISLGLELASQLSDILFFEQAEMSLSQYDRMVRDEAAGKLNEARKEGRLALQIADQRNESRLKGQIFNLTNMMRRTQEKVRYSEGLPRPMGRIDTDGIKYVNLMILCEAFAVLEDTKGGADALEQSEVAKCREIVDKVRERLRQLERMLEVRSTAITVQNRQLLKILADTNPELFGSIKGL
ncbi:MAG TPA: hypothetical protein VM050_11860, partial [Patescibacteria group bacterium]|nr:hypothetical protein [Patescibacteria group bacterium]